MSGGITVKEFKHIPGKNDAEYIKLLEENSERWKRIATDEVAKIKKLSAQLKEQPEQTNCEYCHEDRDGYVMPLEKNGHAFITYSPIDGGFVLSIKYGSWRKNVPVKFCPVCGRRLT